MIPTADLLAGVRKRDLASLGRAVTLVESRHPAHRAAARDLLAGCSPYAGAAHRIGITGAPGAGKSTLIDALGMHLVRAGHRVAVAAVDPTSGRTGGSVLGDRTRMARLCQEPNAFIRPSPSADTLGGVARATRDVLTVVEAAGFDVVLVETVGVGQAEVEVASLADSTVVLLAPGMGDGIQAAKAGILEIADVFVVNKADREGADATARDLRYMMSLADRPAEGAWRTPVLKTVASRGEGVERLVEVLDEHRAWLQGSGELHRRRLRRAADELEAVTLAGLRERLGALRGGRGLDALAERVVAGEVDPFSAADELARGLGSPAGG